MRRYVAQRVSIQSSCFTSEMWIIRGFEGGSPFEITSRVVETDEPPSLEQVRDAATNLPRSERLHAYINSELAFTQENSRFVRSFDAVQRWSARAAGDAGEFPATRGRLVSMAGAENALGYFSTPATSHPAHPDTVVWHDHSLVVVAVPAGVDRIELEYRPDARDMLRAEWFAATFQTPSHTCETILEARTCQGTSSSLMEHFRGMRARGHGFVASVRGSADMLVGSVLRRISKREPAPLEDISFMPRLRGMQQQWHDVATRCLDIGTLSYVHQHDRAMVFIHGTLSCGIQSLKDLFPSAPPPFPVYRYEHDTFLRVSANGHALASLIATYVKAQSLLLVAHSRGGLVARKTLSALAKRGYAGNLQLLTFGTPHAGTPLVTTVKGVLNLMLKVGSAIVDGIPMMSPIAAAVARVWNVSELPDGIKIMEETSESLHEMNDDVAPPEVRCWGSQFDPTQGDSGVGFDVENVLTGIMGNAPHDLVVPLGSALAWGTPAPPLACSHVRYFAEPAVKTAIVNAIAPPPPPTTDGYIDVSVHRDVVAAPLWKFSPSLSSHSRLPRFLTLPAEVERLDANIRLRHSANRSNAEMIVLLTNGQPPISVTCKVYPIVEGAASAGGRRELLKPQEGPLEVIEYNADESVFSVVENAALPTAVAAAALFD